MEKEMGRLWEKQEETESRGAERRADRTRT